MTRTNFGNGYKFQAIMKRRSGIPDMTMIQRMKKDGTFDKAALENMYNTASPYLNEMQRQRMRQLINMLVG